MNTSEEVVDIVDEGDKVIGNSLKKEAHASGLLHRTVIAEVIDSQGRFLLVKQSGSRQDAGQYVSPVGGHVRSGESIDDALKREAAEELGISGFRFKLIGKKIFNREVLGRRENHYFIVYEIYTDVEPKLNHESESFRRFRRAELKEAVKVNPGDFGDAWYFVARNFYPEFL